MQSVSTYCQSLCSLSSLLLLCVSDPTLTVENIIPVMEAVRNWRKLASDYRFFIPVIIQERITEHHFTDKEQSCAAGEWWVHTGSSPSWDKLASVLYHNGEDRALEKMTQYFPKGACMGIYSSLNCAHQLSDP